MKPVVFVIPWYGDDISGGAEAQCNQLAHCLKDEGLEIEVFTTCVKAASADRGVNTMPAGSRMESGILVSRFNVDKRNIEQYNQANYKLYNNIPWTEEEEEWYKNNDINSTEMYEYIVENKDKYHCFIFLPYLYGITYNGVELCKEKSILIPCLHDEPYAYMKLTKELLEKVRGILFLSKPEADLAKKLCNLADVKHKVLGAYIESGWEDKCKPDSFRQKFGIDTEFILYAGRKDSGKGALELLNYFINYKDTYPDRDIKLVFIGGGELEIPLNYRNYIIDLGFISKTDKYDALSAASFLCNPSRFESFSMVIMESWLAGRPVLVNEHCDVTTNFCLESNGGLYYSNYQEFEACVNYLLDNKFVMDKMGENGYEYVQKNFVHGVIGKKYINFINDISL